MWNADAKREDGLMSTKSIEKPYGYFLITPSLLFIFFCCSLGCATFAQRLADDSETVRLAAAEEIGAKTRRELEVLKAEIPLLQKALLDQHRKVRIAARALIHTLTTRPSISDNFFIRERISAKQA